LTSVTPINCPKTTANYILEDTKTLAISTDTEVCVNEFGWYSQEYSDSGATSACKDEVATCGGNVTQSCKTRFQRKITFETCSTNIGSSHCVKALSKVWW